MHRQQTKATMNLILNRQWTLTNTHSVLDQLCRLVFVRGFLKFGFLILPILLTPVTAPANGVQVDERRVEAAGISQTKGRHLTLYTDDRDRKDLNELVTVYDLAVNQWCDHFQLDRAKAANWKVDAFLMVDQEKFEKAGLIPDDLPQFPAGYAIGKDIWLYPQPGNYYTRHLLLHEGTHLFMNRFLGNFGPPWYSEGMAEWLGLHRWDADTRSLQLGYRVQARREAEYWGRVKIVQRELTQGEGMSLDEVFAIGPTAFQNLRFYAWSWAACEFLTHHPLTAKNFSRLKRDVDLPAHRFRRKVLTKLSKEQKRNLERDWNLFVHEIDYGYDIARGTLVDAAPVQNPPSASSQNQKFRVAADRSWLDTGIQLSQGEQVTITAQGQYRVKMTDQPWPCEAGGITLKYYQGKPLGMLMAAVLPAPDQALDINQPLISAQPVGQQQTITAPNDGTLCLRINESPADLADNSGGLEVTVQKLK